MRRSKKVESLFDNRVGGDQQGRRHRKPKRLRSLEIDDHQKLDGHLNWKVCRLCATDNLIYLGGSATKYSVAVIGGVFARSLNIS
jgi:hypothetical protein